MALLFPVAAANSLLEEVERGVPMGLGVYAFDVTFSPPIVPWSKPERNGTA